MLGGCERKVVFKQARAAHGVERWTVGARQAVRRRKRRMGGGLDKVVLLGQLRGNSNRNVGPGGSEEGGRVRKGSNVKKVGNGRDLVHGERASVQWSCGKASLFHVADVYWCIQRQSQCAQICAPFARYVCARYWQHAASRRDFFYF